MRCRTTSRHEYNVYIGTDRIAAESPDRPDASGFSLLVLLPKQTRSLDRKIIDELNNSTC